MGGWCLIPKKTFGQNINWTGISEQIWLDVGWCLYNWLRSHFSSVCTWLVDSLRTVVPFGSQTASFFPGHSNRHHLAHVYRGWTQKDRTGVDTQTKSLRHLNLKADWVFASSDANSCRLTMFSKCSAAAKCSKWVSNEMRQFWSNVCVWTFNIWFLSEVSCLENALFIIPVLKLLFTQRFKTLFKLTGVYPDLHCAFSGGTPSLWSFSPFPWTEQLAWWGSVDARRQACAPGWWCWSVG